MDLPDRADFLEAEPLKLTAEHFPLDFSLRELVIHRYGEEARNPAGEQAMALTELIGYLRSTNQFEQTPMQSILAEKAISDPSMPAAEHTAILNWLGTAFDQWERSFPLEQPLRSELRSLKPLAAKLALTDPDFLTPGSHPLHGLLDSLQLAAVGWQVRLGKVGEALRQRLFSAVEEARCCFDLEPGDLAELSTRVAAAIDKDLARAGRMAQRMIETEQGKSKTAEARRLAAGMVNAALDQFQAPPSVGKFLVGPWYESAQLVLLKFGANSQEWEQMSATTTELLESMQVELQEEAEETLSRHYLFQTVTRFPRELRQWLLSLQHDEEAVGSAIRLVEFAHLQILSKQDPGLEQIEPIPLVTPPPFPAAAPPSAAQPGQWFSIDRGNSEPLRARLVMRIEETSELLFANQAGMKVLRQEFEQFNSLCAGGEIFILDTGSSFSRSLARAAGIETVQNLEAMRSQATEKAKPETRQGQSSQESSVDPEQDFGLQAEESQSEQLWQEWDRARQAQGQAQRQQNSTPSVTGDRGEQAGPGLPEDTWLGFHDDDTPLMAKLATHDRETNTFVFVNRQGVKIRVLPGEVLMALIDDGLVDILEPRSISRKAATPAHKNS